jgi:hypothetical protein
MKKEQTGKRKGGAEWASAWGAVAVGVAVLVGAPRGAYGQGANDTADTAAALESFEPWVTRFDGTFRVRPVTPGRVRALVRHPAYVEGLSEAVTLAPGGEGHVQVTLYAGGSLEGRVVDENKRPVGGARIDLVALRGTLERSTVTADDGTFAFAAS